MASPRAYRVAEVAAIAGVTVRTLHHYDALKLLVPSARSRAGYRLYTDADLLRLQQIVIQRELGLPLEQIRRALDDPSFDLRRALVDQKRALEARLSMTHGMLHAVNAALTALESPHPNPKEGAEEMQNPQRLFEGFDHQRYAGETSARWGDTNQYREAARRTKNYSAADWEQFQSDQTRLYEEMAQLMLTSTAPDSAEAAALCERHRLLIDRWFYPCGPDMHRNLADLYEADSRFSENIDKFGAGLTAFLVAAIRAGK